MDDVANVLTERAASQAQACAEALGAYEQVRNMALLPGWETFIIELQKRAKNERAALEDILDGILLKRTPDLEQDFLETKVRLLAYEEAIQIYLKLRESAREAKEMLDSTPAPGA